MTRKLVSTFDAFLQICHNIVPLSALQKAWMTTTYDEFLRQLAFPVNFFKGQTYAADPTMVFP